jgi:hypothetical protein
MIPLPVIDSTCAYTFNTGFTTLNGIYTVKELLSFDEAITVGIDFVINLYIPAGLSSAQYTTDAHNYANDTVLYLVPANGIGTSIYIPSSLLATVPDPMVGCYNNLAIGVSLGLFADEAALTWIVSEINSIISGVVGVTSPVKLYSLGTTYMSAADYVALVAARTDAQVPYATLYQQLQQQIALATAAQNLNTYYQNTLIALAAP